MIDQTADMLSKIKNSILSSETCVTVKGFDFNLKILDIMKQEGYINSYSIFEDDKEHKFASVLLRYDTNGVPAIRYLKLISKQSRRLYAKKHDLSYCTGKKGNKKGKLSRVHKFSTFIVSTSKGVMSDIDAVHNNVGGEVICEVAS